jgi:hypothetical protein
VRAHKWDATENGTFAHARPAIKYRMFTHMFPSAEKWASVRLGNRDLSTASQRWMSREMGHVLALFYLFRFKNQVTIPRSMVIRYSSPGKQKVSFVGSVNSKTVQKIHMKKTKEFVIDSKYK